MGTEFIKKHYSACFFNRVPTLTAVIFMISLLLPYAAQAVDADDDGMDDAWELAYGLNPNDPLDALLDPDEDGLTNLDEYILGTNPLHADTDGDGIPDGVEVESGMDPLVPALVGNGFKYEERVMEDAEDGLATGWELSSGPLTAQAINAQDPDNQNNWAIFLAGTSDATHRLTFAPFEVNKPIIEWRMRMKSTFYIYVQCVTSLGTRHIRYHSGGTTRMLENNDPEIALGNGAVNSGWVTIRRHLLADLRMFHPGAEIYEVRTFMVRCVDSWVDDIRMLAYPDSDMDLIPDDVEIANGLNPYSAADAELDLDGDGLTNLEEFIIGTDMNNIDTDGDGLTDFDEKHIFGTNPLLADTDGDGVPDDVELENNMDPLTPALAGNGYMYEERIIEDAEDGLVDGWNLWAGALPAQAINAPDPVDPGNRAIFLSGTADACHRLTFSSVESEKLILEWRMRTGSSFYIYVQCATSLGTRHIRYHSGGTTRMLENDDPEIAIQIGPAVNGWYTVRRHLLADLRIFHPDAEIYNVRTFMIRSANGYVDDIRMLAYPDSDMDLIPDDVEIANDLDPYSAADAALDYDNDGLTNLEEFFAGTDMYNADTDGDGISDYAELNTFGTNALSADTDGDGLTDFEEIYDFGTDPLLADTDGDGVPDGVEIDNGMNPFIPALSGNGFMYEERIIEDAEDGLVDGWNLWAGVLPAQAINVPDPVDPGNRAIFLSGTADACHRLTFSSVESEKLILEWRMRTGSSFYIYVQCVTSLGTRHIRYHPGGTTRVLENDDPEIAIQIGPVVNGWHTVRRHLLADLRLVHPDAEIYEVRTFMIRSANGYVDDIRMLAYQDSDMDLIPDDVEIANGLNPFSAEDAVLDNDGDGLTNLEEFIIGTDMNNADTDDDGLMDKDEIEIGLDPLDPFDAETAYLPAVSLPLTAYSGLMARYYKGYFRELPNFDLLLHYNAASEENLDSSVDTGYFMSSGRGAQFAARFDGWLTVPVDGWYRFRLTSNDGARFSLDNTVILDGDGYISHRANPRVVEGGAVLRAGSHIFLMEYFQTYNNHALILEWCVPGQTVYEPVPVAALSYDPDALAVQMLRNDSDGDGLTDAEEIALGTNPYLADTDGDGLTDAEELALGTNPLLFDTDGDGISDYEEVFGAQSNPLAADFTGENTVVTVLDGASFLAVTGNWMEEDSSLTATSRQGSVSCQFSLATAGVYAIEVAATQANSLAQAGVFVVDGVVNGNMAGQLRIQAAPGQIGRACLYLPPLEAGTHTLLLHWRNVAAGTFLKLISASVLELGAVDGDEDGIDDWQQARGLLNTVSAETQILSLVSPFCLEGTASFPDMFALRGSHVPEEALPSEIDAATGLLIIPARRGVGDGWFANVPLSASAATTVQARFVDGFGNRNITISWVPTDIFDEIDNLIIRAGDSLLLSAGDVYDEGTAVILIDSLDSGVTLPGEAVPWCFDQAGEYLVVAALTTPDGQIEEAELIVTVVNAAFASNPAAVPNIERLWTNPGLGSEFLCFDWDAWLSLLDLTGAEDGDRQFSFRLTAGREARIIARLCEDGPIAAVATVLPVAYSEPAAEGYKTLETYSDGSRLVEGRITLGQVPDDIIIRLSVHGGGVLFEDGSLVKEFTAEDFSDDGTLRFRFLISSDSVAAACHSQLILQNGERVKGD